MTTKDLQGGVAATRVVLRNRSTPQCCSHKQDLHGRVIRRKKVTAEKMMKRSCKDTYWTFLADNFAYFLKSCVTARVWSSVSCGGGSDRQVTHDDFHLCLI